MLTESSLVERRKKAAKTISRGGLNKATPPRTKKYYALTKKILTILAIAMILNYLRIHSKSRNSNMRQKDQKVGVLDSSIKTQSQESSGATNGDTLETPPQANSSETSFSNCTVWTASKW